MTASEKSSDLGEITAALGVGHLPRDCSIQISAGAAATEEGGARQVVASQRYRPISNLSTVSKVLERLVLARLRPHLTNSKNFSKRQSAYRQGHSTETALLDVLDSIHTAADSKEVTLLIGLDISAAFDTVCNSTLVKRLKTEFGVSGTALYWIQSYLQDRTQFVKLGKHRSSETTLEVGVPLGSVLGLLLFAVYCSPVADVIASPPPK